MPRVVIVEDDVELGRTLRLNLRAREYDAVLATTGGEALAAAHEAALDLMVLDLGLPDRDGVDVIRELRAWSDAPVIVLSARDGQEQKVAALDAGADDYLTKPFGMDELLARIRAALRRTLPAEASEVVETSSFRLDLGSKKASGPDGTAVRLTPTEWHLLEILVRRSGQLVTQRDLLAQVWGPSYRTETNYLRVYLGQLRRKLERDPSRPAHLITEPGLGYRFEP